MILKIYANCIRATISSYGHKILSNLLVNFRLRKRRHSPLPLPLPYSTFIDSTIGPSEASRVCDVITGATSRIFDMLHLVQRNLEFWQSQGGVSNPRKLHFLILGRGPAAFLKGSVDLVRKCAEEGTTSGFYRMCHVADAYISERIAVLSILRNALASFLAEVYVDVDKLGDDLLKSPITFLFLLLLTFDDLFAKFEEVAAYPLLFEKLPEMNLTQLTESELEVATTALHKNMKKLESYVSLMAAKHRKPKRMTRYWVRYTLGAVGFSLGSLWIAKHSRLMGSPDIENWIEEAKESTLNFFKDHVEQPLVSIRDELFDTFRKRHKGMMEVEEVHLTASSLHRMLIAFAEQTKGEKISENASDQEMMEVVMGRYEKELTHPIQNLVNGELARALLIQVQKLKLDIETAMLELNQILKANEINLAALAAMPALVVCVVMAMVGKAWVQQSGKAEGRGRIGRRQRRLLLAEVEKKMALYQVYVEEGRETASVCMLGILLYTVNRLFQAVEKHAEATGEWECLREDFVSLTKPSLPIAHKLIVTSRMERLYECLLPSFRLI